MLLSSLTFIVVASSHSSSNGVFLNLSGLVICLALSLEPSSYIDSDTVQIWKIASPASPPHFGQIYAQNKAKPGETTLDSEVITPHGEATLDPQKDVILAQSEASEASEGIFSIKEANATEEAPQAKDLKERDIRDIIAKNRENIYRLGRSNRWACKGCTFKADRQFMEIHVCTKSKRKKNNGPADSLHPTKMSNPTLTKDSNDVPCSDSIKPYEHLIEMEYLPSLDCTAYRCKEHPSVPYYDLEGIEESHFKPFHTDPN